ncbi:MAG: hypothetical protein U0Q16_35740 [Bryobacteraceae bacterium]
MRIRPVWIGFAALVACGALPMMAQNTEISAVGGIGYAAGDRASGGGAAVGFAGFGATRAVSGVHGVQMDYLYASYRFRSLDNHFLTVSYVLQPLRAGTERRFRPFLNIGGGLRLERSSTGMFAPRQRSTGFSPVFGGGFSYDIGWSMFVAPQVRCYASPGVTLTVLPTVAVGWRF